MTLSVAALCEAFRNRTAAVHDIVSYSYKHGALLLQLTTTRQDIRLVFISLA